MYINVKIIYSYIHYDTKVHYVVSYKEYRRVNFMPASLKPFLNITGFDFKKHINQSSTVPAVFS